MTHTVFRNLLQEAGLLPCPPFHRDRHFYAAVFAGLVVLATIYLFMPVYKGEIGIRECSMFAALVIWQPFWEELLFRGIIQGQLSKQPWGRRAFLRISNANIISSIAFAVTHIAYDPGLRSIMIFVPSLVFGYFRDRHNSIYSAYVLHGFYNLGYLFVVFVKPDCS